ncbi:MULTISPECIES: STAS domain-containing protein [Bacillaceae]|uniref:STAS domain-containing protein n=1 Tax=Bacillaceae TaxID=186817 RepID=UPI000BFB73A6|nr:MULTISPECIES: STAS domain-containing protein [Bacillaceae]PGT81468.1 modulator protein [Bacillus sp. AFS040349]UGB31499.1 STAS domain-containing protein [Metabacillus sp. B2-18]
MKEELKYIGQKIVENDLELAKKVVFQKDSILMKQIELSKLPIAERIKYRAILIRYFGKALYGNLDEIREKVICWGREAAQIAIRDNISLSSTLRGIYLYRTVIWDAFTEELNKREFAPITMLDVSKIIDPLLDLVCEIIGEEFEKHNQKLMEVAYTALEELSVPVVPIVKGIVVLPIVGAVDTHRAKLIMDISLHESARLGVSYLILDVSGVPIIDTMVANQLFQVVKALQLTGVEVIITGIRPEIAQTVVKLGIHFGDIKTRATMMQALYELGITKS